MPAPPWALYSPTRVLYYIRDETYLERLSEDEGIRLDHLQQLVGIKPSAVGAARYTGKCPRHRAKWQLVDHSVRWLQRVDKRADQDELIPVGEDEHFFCEQVASLRDDMAFFKPERLALFVKGDKSQLFNSGKRVDIYTCKQKGGGAPEWIMQ